jgi:hypothetical protein
MTPYQEIRAAGRAMHSKALESTKHLHLDPLRIARHMTLPHNGRTLIFDGEAAQNAFFDFWFHEYRVNGQCLVESVDPVAAGLTPIELEVLTAHRQAHTSFFAALTVARREPQVLVRDLLDPAHPELQLTDLGLSDSMRRLGVGLAMFLRLVVVRGIAMTSGFTFSFDPARTPGILQAYRQKTKRVPPEDLPEARFVFFFQKYRQFGVEQEFRDVV